MKGSVEEPVTAMMLPPAVLEDLFAESVACWPREACGVVMGAPCAPEGWRFVRFDNEQDRLHASDPERFPRDARTAYAMNPLKLQRLVDDAEAVGEALLAIAHSHPQHPSYFSATDAAAAAPFGAPTYPGALQLVVSVYDREVRDLKGFAWDGAAWAEVLLPGAPALRGPPPGATPYGEL